MQIEHKWCDKLNNDNLKYKLYTAYNLWEKNTTPFPIVYFVIFHGGYIQMTFFPDTPKCSPKIRTFVIPKLWTFIFSSTIWSMQGKYFVAIEKIFPIVYYMPKSKIISPIL